LYDYLVRWNDDNTLIAIHHALYLQCREMMQREPSPTACVVDSQSVKGTEKGGGISSSIRLGWCFMPLCIRLISERDGGILLIATLFGRFPFLRRLFADGGIRGHNSSRRSPVYFRNSTSRSSSDPMRLAGSSCCHADGRGCPRFGVRERVGSQRRG
jgi:hypothetical protein